MSYGSNSEAQIIAYGATNADLDTICESARKVATAVINAHLNLKTDTDAPSDEINSCCDTLAAAIISTSPEATAESALWKAGMDMLKNLPDNSSDASWGVTIPVDRF